MQGMEEQQAYKKDNKEMIDMNIKEFLNAAHQYLFGLMPAQQPALASIPLHQAR